MEVVDGAIAGAWIEPGLGGDFGAVSLQVPKVFESYARIFHPAQDREGNAYTWAEVARRLGRVAHREMQWHQLVGSSDSSNFSGSKWDGNSPLLGEMPVDDVGRLRDVLAAQTDDPAHCFFGFCWINHSYYLRTLPSEEIAKPQLKLPFGRDHLVFAGPLDAVDVLGGTERVWRESPSLIWPADRSWLVASEVDFDSTLVGGSRELVEALVAASGLEVYEVEPGTSLASFSDKLNPVPKPERD